MEATGRHDADDRARGLSLDAHRTVELAIGLALIVAPVVLNFPVGGFVLAAGPGALLAGVALAATREGRALTGTTHRYADIVLAGTLVAAAVLSAALLAPVRPTVALAVAAVAEGALIAATRYVERQ